MVACHAVTALMHAVKFLHIATVHWGLKTAIHSDSTVVS